MRQETITCDSCGKDLSQTGPRPAYRIAMACESIPHASHYIASVYVEPDLDRSYHFCSLRCLGEYGCKNWWPDEGRTP